MKSLVKAMVPQALLSAVTTLTRKNKKVRFGDLNQLTPYSTQFGYDRGGPVDRYYIEQFLDANATKIKGRVLEIGDNEYTLRYGQPGGVYSEVLHVDSLNQNATIIGDLTSIPQVPDNHFDCIILTQTLHLIYDYKQALATCYRILKPGGFLLLTVPGISHIDHGEWKYTWLWSSTDVSTNMILSEHFKEQHVETKTYGNVQVATAFLYGLGLPELTKEQMEYTDPHYQVIITSIARK